MNRPNPKMTYMLVKYGKLHRLEQLLEHGYLYLGTIESIRAGGNAKKDDHRIDYLEGAKRYFSKGPLELTMIPKGGKPIKIQAQNLTYSVKSERVIGNVCSFYSIDDRCFLGDDYRQIDTRMGEFGEHAILITNIDEFFKRIKNAVPEPEWDTLWHKHVEYFDEMDFADNLNMFKKRSLYEYQNEYRVFLQGDQEQGAILNLGPLRDIAVIVPAEATFRMRLTKEGPALQMNFNSKNILSGNGGFTKRNFFATFFDWIGQHFRRFA